MTITSRRFQGIIFDFNGVLFWDNALHEEAWRRYSATLRGYPLTDDEMTHHVHGRVNKDIFGYVLGEPVAAERSLALAAEKEAIYRELCLAAGETLRLSPGAAELLDELTAQGIPRAIATSSAWPNVAFYLERLNLERWFPREWIIFDEGRYPGKPAPDIYLTAAARLGPEPGECVVVEDSLAGIQSAAAAGISRIIALGPPERHAALAALDGVDAVVASLREFPVALIALE